MKNAWVKLTGAEAIMGNKRLAPIDLELYEGEAVALVGENGSGKSTLLDVLRGAYAFRRGTADFALAKALGMRQRDVAKKIAFEAAEGVLSVTGGYYQQRFNHTENEECAVVGDLFGEGDLKGLEGVAKQLDLGRLMGRRTVMLSSGELRRVLILKALAERPKILLVDNPFIGLDVAAREVMEETFGALGEMGITVVFAVASETQIPRCAARIIEMKEGAVVWDGARAEYGKKDDEIGETPAIEWERLHLVPQVETPGDEVVGMENVEIAYGKNVINRGIDWMVKKGEKWALLGPNGSGKSTLLSYVFADNPQAYAKRIRLFGRQRGTGESIWDIKRRIGFTSSELHLYYREDVECGRVVESGYRDTIGLFGKRDERAREAAEYLMEQLGIGHLTGRKFLQTSAGEQRMVLLARAMVKDPELLVLDEPFHGLDDKHRVRAKAAIEAYARRAGKTLVIVSHCVEDLPEGLDKTLRLQRHERG